MGQVALWRALSMTAYAKVACETNVIIMKSLKHRLAPPTGPTHAHFRLTFAHWAV